VSLPGGYGTLDELFEIATLIQTHKMRDFPCVIMGREYYQPLLDFLSGTLVREGAIDQADFDRLTVTDSAEEAVEHIREAAIRKFGLHYVERARQRPNGPV
jgi:predicted Rossmann-fold nucleotide-binding protein